MNLTEPLLIPPDRYAYLANLVMLMGVYDCAAGAAWMGKRFTAVGFALGVWVAYSLVLCWAQVAVWQDSYTLFAYLDAQPDVEEHADIRYQVQCDLAGQLTVDGRYEEAISEYLDYTRHHGKVAAIFHQMGLDYFEMGQYTQALVVLKEAYALQPNPVTKALMQAVQQKLAEKGGGSLSAPAAKP
jgi:tetratricopeptide (TPR) repeat protein